MSRKLLVIRLRGQVDLHPDVKHTLKLLRLHKKFHAVLVDESPSILGMLRKISNYVTWGEIDKDTLAVLLERRGRLSGRRRLTLEYVQKLGFRNFKELAEAILDGRISIKDLKELKPVFRLHPPSGGFKYTIKKRFGAGGELGYRGSAINELVRRMA
ncbi:MAG: 50S ribosomal protein L30 [Thermoprotei archaeon]|nr:MAG: 50S ribosomal protein L30 [Thermoprotei archaeon]